MADRVSSSAWSSQPLYRPDPFSRNQRLHQSHGSNNGAIARAKSNMTTGLKQSKLPPPPKRSLKQLHNLRNRDKVLENFLSPPSLPEESESSSSYGRHSKADPYSRVGRNQLAIDNEAVNEAFKAVLKERMKVIGARASIEKQQHDIATRLPLNREAYKSMFKSLQEILPQILRSNIPADKKTVLEQQWVDFEQLATTLEIWQSHLEREENDLLARERRLFAKEDDLYKLLAAMDPQSFIDYAALQPESPMEASLLRRLSMSSTTSWSTDLDEREYYRQIGEVNLLRDRVFNLESDFRIQRFVRENDAEQGLQLDSTDEQVFETYILQREALAKQYFQAMENIEVLAQTCYDKQIEVEPPSLPPFLDQIFEEGHDDLLQSVTQSSSGDTGIVCWIQDVLMSSQFHRVASTGTDLHRLKSDVQPDVTHCRKAKCEAVDHPLFDDMITASFAKRTYSFQGDFKHNQKRHSAPELHTIWLNDRICHNGQPTLGPSSCINCLLSNKPHSTA